MHNVIEILKKFYDVDTLEEVVLAQNEHIASLQRSQVAYPQIIRTKVREG